MSGKIIVAGAFGALGRAVVAELGNRGFSVAAIDLAPVPADTPGIAIGGIDLSDEPAVAAAYDSAKSKLGGLTGLVNVAGGFVWETMADGAIDTWDRMYRMNLRTAAVSCRAGAALLENGGAIVNVGAAAAANAAIGMAPYAASKAGVMALTQSLADELRGRMIRVNAVLPTILDTPANRRDMPDADFSTFVELAAAARVIALLLSADAAAVTGAGVPLSVGQA